MFLYSNFLPEALEAVDNDLVIISLEEDAYSEEKKLKPFLGKVAETLEFRRNIVPKKYRTEEIFESSDVKCSTEKQTRLEKLRTKVLTKSSATKSSPKLHVD